MRRARPGRVALEVDGRPWRTVPDEVVLRCGLAAGVQLERPLLRELRHALREAEALNAALRALERKPLSERRLQQRLRVRGALPSEARKVTGTLSAAGLLDDERLAAERARLLADRGWGNVAIEARLRSEGLGDAAVHPALARLDPELHRARWLVTGMAPRKGWSLLARRGFDPDTIAEAVGALDAGA